MKRIFDGDHAYILQQDDKRIIFAIPYEQKYTLIGTTEAEYTGDPRDTAIDDNEIEYLCDAINHAFRDKISKKDIIWSYSGVRPLIDDGADSATSASRDYKLVYEEQNKRPLLSVFGGKITTYRHLSEEAVDLLMDKQDDARFGKSDHTALPGGDIPDRNFFQYLEDKDREYQWLPPETVRRYVNAYGTMIDDIIGGAKKPKDLGKHYGEHIYEAEIRHMVEQEWAQTIEDILMRRSKLGLHITDKTIKNIEKALPDLLATHAAKQGKS